MYAKISTVTFKSNSKNGNCRYQVTCSNAGDTFKFIGKEGLCISETLVGKIVSMRVSNNTIIKINEK